MKVQRMPLVLLGAVVAVVIAVAGSYYGFFARNDGLREHGLPSYAVGAENVVETHVYLGQPDDYSNETGRSDVIVDGVIDELLPSKWTTADREPPEEITREVVKDLDTHVRTIAVLNVEDVYKGESIGETLNFSFRGGRVGDTVYIHEWNEVFKEDARVILFLDRGEGGSPAKRVVLLLRRWTLRGLPRGCTCWSRTTALSGILSKRSTEQRFCNRSGPIRIKDGSTWET